MRQKQHFFLAAFLFLLWSLPADAGAQSREKKQRRTSRETAAPAKKTDVSAAVEKHVIEYPVSKIKNRYRIDVLIPLYIQELVQNEKPTFKDRLPEKAVGNYDFYEGVKLAADTLNSLGYNLDVYVHDISQENLAPESLVKYKIILGTDLIIGLVSSGHIPELASFAKKNRINFISAASPSDADIRDNPFFTILQPTLRTHCEKIKATVLKHFPTKKVLVLARTTNSVDSSAYAFTNSGAGENFQKLFWNQPPEKAALEKLLDSNIVNPLVVPIIDQNYADSLLLQLVTWFPAYRFEIYGMPTWKAINTLRKPGVYPNATIIFSAPFSYDLSSPLEQMVAADYKKAFNGRPSEMVFRGYETLYWYAYLLQKYGTVFNSRLYDTAGAAFTSFDIRPQWSDHNELLYLENEHTYNYRYNSGSFTVEE